MQFVPWLTNSFWELTVPGFENRLVARIAQAIRMPTTAHVRRSREDHTDVGLAVLASLDGGCSGQGKLELSSVSVNHVYGLGNR